MKSKLVFFCLLLMVFFALSCKNDPTSQKKDFGSPPTASFSFYPDQGSTFSYFYFNASSCIDNEDSLSVLEVRWDWESDEIWDTEYSTNKSAMHRYVEEGFYQVNLEVKNTRNLTKNTSKYLIVVQPQTGTVEDIDGNTYITVKIGSQWWMAENLKVTRYRNGDSIPNLKEDSTWANPLLNTGAYCILNNDSSFKDIYGILYNWYAVNDERDIAPIGWHIPTDDEWKELEMYLGMSKNDTDVRGEYRGTNEGSKLKQTDPRHLYSNATNETGFSALLGGARYHAYGSFYNVGYEVSFWSATELLDEAWYRALHRSCSGIFRSHEYKRSGFSIRCIKD